MMLKLRSFSILVRFKCSLTRRSRRHLYSRICPHGDYNWFGLTTDLGLNSVQIFFPFFFLFSLQFLFLKSLISPLLFSHFFFNFPSFHSVLSHDLTRKRSKAAKKETFFLCFVSLSHNVFSVSISFPLSERYICHCRSFQALLFLFQKTQKGLCLYVSRLDTVYDLRSFLVLF